MTTHTDLIARLHEDTGRAAEVYAEGRGGVMPVTD